jgi:hypothetical protein
MDAAVSSPKKIRTANEVTAAARALLRQAACPECGKKGYEDSQECAWCDQRVEFTATELLRDFEAERAAQPHPAYVGPLEIAQPPGVWQPIETAPQALKLLVAYLNRLGNWRIVIARYYKPGTLTCDGDDADEDGYAPEGWYEESESHEYILRTDEPPTHWMRLPTAPVEKTSEAST